jgi:hypothetical protein
VSGREASLPRGRQHVARQDDSDIIGLQVSRFLGAAVVVEAVFDIPGIGTLVVGTSDSPSLVARPPGVRR